MSERIQRHTQRLAEAAREREREVRARADASRARGDELAARVHDQSADRQAETARAAEGLLAADRRAEGDQLGD